MKPSMASQAEDYSHTHTQLQMLNMNSSPTKHVKFCSEYFLKWFIPNSPVHPLPLVGYIPFSLATNSDVWLQALENKRNKTKMNELGNGRQCLYRCSWRVLHNIVIQSQDLKKKTPQHKQENRNVDKRKTETRSIKQNSS
jgi:hypothetical protein